MNSKILMASILTLTFMFSACDGQYIVTGVVKDTDQQPLPGVKVEFYYPESSRDHSGTTDEKGEFDLSYISGWSDQDGYILVSKNGFKKQSKPYVAGKDGHIEIVLEKASAE